MSLSARDSDFVRNTFDFMKKNAIYPKDYDHNVMAKGSIALFDKSRSKTKVDDLVTVDKLENKIAYTKLDEVIGGVDRMRKRAYSMMFFPKSELSDPSSYIPMWFLPWQDDRLTALTIPPKVPLRPGQALIRNPPHDPDIFFTAAINGCSVIVHGSPKSPTISHGGTTKERSKGYDSLGYAMDDAFEHGNARLHWQKVHRNNFGNASGYDQARGISAGDYVNYMGTKTTPEAEEYSKFLKKETKKSLKITSVIAQGCVFGLRDAQGDWSFYLQKNIEVTIVRLKKKYGIVGSRVPVMRSYVNAAPTSKVITEKGFDATNAVQAKQQFTEDTIQMTIPIHLVKFYPGTGSSPNSHTMLDKNSVKAICEDAFS